MAEPKPIWIDTDIVFNQFPQDVDDGLALMMALDCPRVRVQGISLNRRVDNGERVTRRLLGHYARYPVPVYKGTDNIFAGPGERTEAVDRLADALRGQPLTIVAIGAATNLANLLRFHPDVASRITRIVFCAGRKPSQCFRAEGRSMPLPDANFDNDPQSMREVIESGIPVTLAGFEASSSIFIDAVDIERIRRNGRDGDRWVAQRLALWRLAWMLAFRLGRFIPFDACTIGAVLYPECFHVHRQIPVAVNTRRNDARFWKKGANKAYLEVSYAFDSTHRVDYAYAVDPVYKTLLMQHLLGQAP
ncbi:MAG: nucleoside hydrolase [Pseudomonadota bacterium]